MGDEEREQPESAAPDLDVPDEVAEEVQGGLRPGPIPGKSRPILGQKVGQEHSPDAIKK